MAVMSMTGFGRGEAAAKGLRVEVEISTVNRKQLDVRLNLPRSVAGLESRAHDLIHKRLSRGQVSGVVRVSDTGQGPAAAIVVDMPRAQAAVTALRKAAKELKLSDDLTSRVLIDIPHLLQCPESEEDAEQVWPLLRKSLQAALKALVAMRRTEGEALAQDLTKRLSALGRLRRQIATRAPRAVARYRSQLSRRLKDAGIDADANDPQLSREIVLFAERCEISEELVRIESHVAHAGKLMRSTKPVGRALDFVCQELAREINTIGAKSNDTDIARRVIQFKSELENIREQVQNIE